MALKIRLRRMGRKKAPTYRIVVAESSMPRDGRFVANIGHYNPRTEPMTLVVDRERALSWIEKGATPTDTAMSLLKRAGVFNPEQSAVEAAVETVKETAKKATKAAKGAATKAKETVQDAVETVTGGEAEAPVAEATAETEVPEASESAEPAEPAAAEGEEEKE